MTDPDRAEIDAALDRLAEAWAASNPDAVAAAFAPDGVYAASVGPDPGEVARGRAAIRALAARMFATDAGRSELVERLPLPDGAFWTWRILEPDGTVTLGCDRVRVRNSHVVLKDAYRKTAS